MTAADLKSNNSVISKVKYTPMIEQYLLIKEQYQDCLLFYRMGDFYELFFHDASFASQILNIVLTRKAQQNADDVPMCGVPYHSCGNYIDKLITQGFKIAICEQIETVEQAKKRGGSQAIVKRDVVRVITPGTVLEASLLNDTKHNLLATIIYNEKKYALGLSDITTGLLQTIPFQAEELLSLLNRFEPQEIIISEELNSQEFFKPITEMFKRKLTIRPNSFFEFNKNTHKITSYYQLLNLDLLKTFSKAELIAVGSLIEYLSVTQKDILPKIQLPQQVKLNHFMKLDYNTIKHLELFKDCRGSEENSIFKVINQTKTSIGSRLLYQYLQFPLIDLNKINERLDAVEFLYHNQELSNLIRQELASIPDLERLVNRVVVNKAGPRDLNAIKAALISVGKIKFLLSSYSLLPKILDNIQSSFKDQIFELSNLINKAFIENPPLVIKDGGFINSDYDSTVNELGNLVNNSKVLLTQLRDEYRAMTNVNLKIEYHQNFGFCIETSPQQGQKLINHPEFILRQTLISCLRFTTPKLQDLEQQILSAKAQLVEYELNIYKSICNLISENATLLQNIAHNIGMIDIFTNFAFIANCYNYTRPFIDNSKIFEVSDGRHALIEQILHQKREFYQNNNCRLDPNKLIGLITGPNMGGKSTYLRSNAIIAILAQVGCFVPASSCHIGIIDSVFARVGASDELSRAMSTFMVEMSETAYILSQATDRSLIIIDEIGRGTATYDGMAIAYATLEYIYFNLQAKCLFATHFHELTILTEKLDKICCLTVKVSENQGNIIFHHHIIPGVADKSYGIFVAKLAGIPKPLIKRAEQILNQLENKQLNLDLVQPIQSSSKSSVSLIEQHLNSLEIDNLTPKQALEQLYHLKSLTS